MMLRSKNINKPYNFCNYFLNDKNNAIVIIFNYTYNIFYFFVNTTGIYLIWIFLHYVSSQLYIELCVPKSIIGFVMSPFMTSTPQCQALRWVIYNGANIINNMWILFGTWLCSTILIMTNKPNNHVK